MRHAHLECFAPVCPVCRTDDVPGAPIHIATAARETEDDLLEGTLVCSNTACRCEFPVVDGIPILVPDVRGFVARNEFTLLARRDLGPDVESLIGDCCGPGSNLDTVRQHLSHYAAGHYGDWRIEEPEPVPHGVASLARTLWDAAGEAPDGPSVDLGCSVGRGTFEMADRFGQPVLGLDLNVAMLRTASALLRDGRVTVPRRRVGVVYDHVDIERRAERPDLVDFWAADASCLPFEPGTFFRLQCANLLDCVADPTRVLRECERLLATGGLATLCTPYDWSPSATAIEGWIGGHSQRSPYRGASETLLRDLLTPGAGPWSLSHLEIVAEFDRLPWEVRLHDRSVVRYEVHGLVVARR